MKKLLIVDNSIVIINVLKDLFTQKNDFDIYIAKSLKEVEALLEKHDFFIAISNMVLPDALDGELLNTFKKKSVPTIILSSKIDSDFINSIDSLKVIDYVLKDSMHGLETVYSIVELIFYIKDMQVLIVEDSISLANQIKDILETLLLKVKVVSNGEEAIAELESNENISMIITDFNMPKMNGLELTKVIRKDSTHSNMPIIIMSSEEDKELKIRLFKNGANDFLSKPILPEELKSKIMDIFSNIKQVEEIKSFDRIFDENIISSSTDSKGVIKSVSNAFVEISGYSREELIGKNHNIVRHPDMPNSIYNELWSTISSGNCWKGEIKNLRKDGTSYWVSAIIEPVFDREKKITGYYALRTDITDKKRIYELSITDGLTGLYNRRYFNDIAKSHMDKTVRNNEVFSFMILDIDNFKKYNDTYGHQEGDDVLIKVSQCLKESFKRSDDLVFRLGGEEFGVLINTKSMEDAISMTEIARNNIELLNIEHSKNLPLGVVTASFGLVVISPTEEKGYILDEIYKKADDCLYEAKENGRNRIEFIEI